jgi:hypothetical protein
VTADQIIACAIAWTAAVVAIAALMLVRRARSATPGTPPPREYCGNLAPQIFEHSPRTECVLRPGHSGSHANERGARWWYDPNLTVEDGAVCEAYRVPATAEDSGLCAGCGMSDYKHREASDA